MVELWSFHWPYGPWVIELETCGVEGIKSDGEISISVGE